MVAKVLLTASKRGTSHRSLPPDDLPASREVPDPRRRRNGGAKLAASAVLATPVPAAVITQNADLNSALMGSGYWARSFTIDANDWNSISFSWLAVVGGTGPAAGSLFLLSEEYLDSPASLNSTIAGFIAESTGVNSGRYAFAPAVTLNANTQYWAYIGDASTLVGGGFNTPSNCGGGTYYQPTTFLSSTVSYSDFGGDFDAGFRVSGTLIPEPSATVLIGLCAPGLVAGRRKVI